jgi:hypothetical protein
MRAIIVNNIDSEEGRQAGAIEMRHLDGEIEGVAFRCPCGCGFTSWLPVRPDERGWQWDGNEDAPTLTPSVLQSGMPCKWHGFLTAGEWKAC